MELKRSSDRYLGGVCGGIAEWFHLNPTLVRVIFVFVTLLTFLLPGLILYIILWLTMIKPDE
ncbi:MAG: PspC domain-containing protein [Bacteroidetes bacterium]|nr:PspC domain-containing protein [Bacteroidota bacterium]